MFSVHLRLNKKKRKINLWLNTVFIEINVQTSSYFKKNNGWKLLCLNIQNIYAYLKGYVRMN